MAATTPGKLTLWWQGAAAASGDRQAERRHEGLRRSLPRRWVVERTFSWFGRNRRLAKDFETLPKPWPPSYPRLHPASPQAACQGVGVNSTNHGWQRTMTKVGKSDGEGTFPGTRGNDKVAP